MAATELTPGHDVEISYRLDYKVAEVKRLPDAGNFTHVTTRLGDGPADPKGDLAKVFTRLSETTPVTEDDQLVTFVTQVKGLDGTDTEAFGVQVFALYGTERGPATGAEAIHVADLVVRDRRPK